jgi:hypothetical protein
LGERQTFEICGSFCSNQLFKLLKAIEQAKAGNGDRGIDRNRSTTDNGENDADDEEEGDINNLRNGPESDRSLVYEEYKNLPFQSRTVSKADARKEINVRFSEYTDYHTLRAILQKVSRKCIQEATNAEYTMEIFGKPGVSAERLAQFKQDPITFGPKVHNSFIDKRGDTRTGYKVTQEFRESKWNQEMIHKIANLCVSIVKDCPDKGRFGSNLESIQWHTLVGDRFKTIYVDIVNALPLDDKESNEPALIKARLEKEYEERNTRNGAVSARRAVSRSSSGNRDHALNMMPYLRSSRLDWIFLLSCSSIHGLETTSLARNFGIMFRR